MNNHGVNLAAGSRRQSEWVVTTGKLRDVGGDEWKEYSKLKGSKLMNIASASVCPTYLYRAESANGMRDYSNDEVYFLLGEEINAEWTDFGGAVDATDNFPSDTACREFSEESLGVMPGVGRALKRNLTFTAKLHVVDLSESTNRVMYFTAINAGRNHPHYQGAKRLGVDLFMTPIEVNGLDGRFDSRKNSGQLTPAQKEKQQLAWLKASDVVENYDSHRNPNGKKYIGNDHFTLYKTPGKPSDGVITKARLRGDFRKNLQAFLDVVTGAGEIVQEGFIKQHGSQIGVIKP